MISIARMDGGTAMAKLRPCPFCGGKAISHYIPPHRHFIADMPDYDGSGFVECCVCTAVLSAATEEDAIKAWNRRTHETD